MSTLNTQPILSVIVVAYKSAAEIADCLSSLPRTIAGQSVEVVVVDNSSDRETAALVGQKFAGAVYHAPAENLGFGRGNNVGFEQTSGRFVLFLNPDTISNEAALLHCIRRLETDVGIGMISPKLTLADGAMDLACRRSIPNLWDGLCRASGLAAAFPNIRLFAGYNLTYRPPDGTYSVGAINGAFMLCRREVFQSVGRFDESFFMYGDDLDLCIRVARAGWRIVYDGSVNIMHLKGTSVRKEYELMSEAVFDANRDVYLKHFNPKGSRYVKLKYHISFGLWKTVALWRARRQGRRTVRPL